MKRIFERKNGSYCFEEPDGTVIYHRWQVEDFPSPEEREAYLADLGTGSETESDSINMLGYDRSPEYCEGLLRSLKTGNYLAPFYLAVFFADAPEVRPALIEAARNAPPEDLANFIQALELIGGKDTEVVLRLRLHELLNDPLTFLDADFFNFHGGSLVGAARALLKLNADDEEAIEAFSRMLEHPCRFNRESAVMYFRELLLQNPDHRLPQMLRDKAESVLASPEPVSFLRPLPDERVLELGEQALSDPSVIISLDDLYLLDEMRMYKNERAKNILSALLPGTTSLDSAMLIQGAVGGSIPDALLEELAAWIRRNLQDESPVTRFECADQLKLLSTEKAEEIALEALLDEPEPVVQNRLKKYVETSVLLRKQQPETTT